MATAIPVPDNAVAPTKRQLQNDDPSSSVQNVHKLATEFGILFAWLNILQGERIVNFDTNRVMQMITGYHAMQIVRCHHAGPGWGLPQ